MKKIHILLIATVLVIIAISLWWIHGTNAVDKKDTTKHTFVIQKGQGLRSIAAQLQQAGLIPDQLVFVVLVKELGLDGKIQAGDYTLTPSQTPKEIAQEMTKGSLDIWITIPEGKRATEIAETLESKMTNYDATWQPALIEQEGYLFPDTYLIPRDATLEQVISIMKNNFENKYNEASQNPTAHLSKSDAVILASIVEREGRSAQDKKMVASVLENRLGIGMALQADATIQYVVGNAINWWPTPTSQNLAITSAYNTYKNPGLPPTPIANPGLDALIAVFHPAPSNYLYYFTDGKGITHYARTLDDQNANIRKYGL